MKSLAALLSSVLLFCQCSTLYAATQTTTLSVPGMTCASCPITVKKALSRVQGVKDVAVSYEKKEATVTFDDAQTTLAALVQATTNAGYPSTAKAGTGK